MCQKKSFTSILPSFRTKHQLKNKLKQLKRKKSIRFLRTYQGRHLITKRQTTNTKMTDAKDIMKKIDDLPLHPKNKILIYQCYVLSKLSWNLNIADIDISWVKQSLDNIVNQYVRSWLEIFIAGILQSWTKYLAKSKEIQ